MTIIHNNTTDDRERAVVDRMGGFLEAALWVLERADSPLTAEEITQRALSEGVLRTNGKTPTRSMSARLYLAVHADPNGRLQRLFQPGPLRAVRDSVCWSLMRPAPPAKDGG